MAATAAAIVDSACLVRAATRQIRVLTVDEHQLIQEGLAVMINQEDDMTVVAAASSGEEAIAAIRRRRPDVGTLDMLLPDIPGEDLARRILAEFAATRIVVGVDVTGLSIAVPSHELDSWIWE
jgi:DNA-binding NarL/FixJ family response regulator